MSSLELFFVVTNGQEKHQILFGVCASNAIIREFCFCKSSFKSLCIKVAPLLLMSEAGSKRKQVKLTTFSSPYTCHNFSTLNSSPSCSLKFIEIKVFTPGCGGGALDLDQILDLPLTVLDDIFILHKYEGSNCVNFKAQFRRKRIFLTLM